MLKSRPGLYEWKRLKSWFNEEYLPFLDQRKQIKMQWFQIQGQSNVNNVNNVRREVDIRTYMEKKRKYCIWKVKLMNLKTNTKKNNIREFYRGIKNLKDILAA
jgi:hypothetical protein